MSVLLTSGYAVAMTDYQGLDDLGLHPLQEPGPHPFLEPYTAAYNVIDAVRALRHLFPNVSPQWAAAGGSQGGQAAWAVNEFNPDYGQDLDFVGAVALAPAVNLTPLADLAFRHRMSQEQLGVMPLVIVGLQRAGLIPEHSSYLRGDVARSDFILGCGPGADVARSQVAKENVGPDSSDAMGTLRRALQLAALPQRPLSAPMLVINGKRDDTVPPSWVSFSINQSCRLGGRIQHIELADAGHIVGLDAEAAQRWLRLRFDGGQPESNCPS